MSVWITLAITTCLLIRKRCWLSPRPSASSSNSIGKRTTENSQCPCLKKRMWNVAVTFWTVTRQYNKSINTNVQKIQFWSVFLQCASRELLSWAMWNSFSYCRTVLTPMLVRPGKMWSNFWGALSDEGFYSRSEDYSEILDNTRR